MDNLHFVPNNILTIIFIELTKYKNNFQYYLNYICRNYTIRLNVYLLNKFINIHGVTS